MKVRIVCPNLVVLARDDSKRAFLAEWGFTVTTKKSDDGSEFLKCEDDLEKDVTLEELVRFVKSLKLVATVFQDGVVSLDQA